MKKSTFKLFINFAKHCQSNTKIKSLQLKETEYITFGFLVAKKAMISAEEINHSTLKVELVDSFNQMTNHVSWKKYCFKGLTDCRKIE